MAENAATQAVEQTAAVVGDVNAHLSLIGMIAHADIIVQMVMLLLVLASFWCWAIIFNKWTLFRALTFRTDRFEKLFASSLPLDQMYARLKKSPDNPMASVFVVSMRELREGDLKNVNRPSKELKESVKEKVYQAMHATKNRALARLEGELGFLATVGSSSPFVGLFGTVWGIMNSFQSIAASKNTTLVVVAPGIAEALLATAIGLFAAIPAVIFYNIFSGKIREYAGQIEDFTGQLNALICHDIDVGSSSSGQSS